MINFIIICAMCVMYEMSSGLEMLAKFGRGVALSAIICNALMFLASEIRRVWRS